MSELLERIPAGEIRARLEVSGRGGARVWAPGGGVGGARWHGTAD